MGYIGTYTKGKSEGIYSFVLNTNEPSISDVKVAANIENPTYLAISKKNTNLYTVAKEGNNGGVAAFTIEPKSGKLELLNAQVTPGSPPCHVSVDEKNGVVLSANYHKGTVEAYLTNKDGSITPPASSVQHTGSAPDPRQEKAHTHYAANTPDDKYIVAVELGIDKVFTYTANEEGMLKEVSVLNVKPGSGPRHLEFHPSLPIAYLMTEFSSEVIVLAYDSENGGFSVLQSISTLPTDFHENNQGSAIHVSSDGKFVYAANRGHDSIVLFQVNDKDGLLTFIEHTSTEGNWPRDFALDPSEKFLLASNQESSNLVLFSRDAESGKLTLISSDIVVPDPVCVKFLNV